MNLVTYIHIENVDKLGKTPAQIMNDLLKVYNVPQERQVRMFKFEFFFYVNNNIWRIFFNALETCS